ncbi:adenosylcobinamide-phosphate synthase CbiB [Methylotenera sp. L2L1]|uniref:adenosylcobinamide-phosphate synthase CbiB n=1 Tax=Methylotenera sp. L2L1 TaxID=1502770 RepID=UPI000690E27B|nr:adenosylcobinamide-phosphate synthase CbiB [Methylotenera sp. L2L1]
MSFDYYPINTYSTALAVIAAVLLDALLGEPKRWHPLVGFGWLAHTVERAYNKNMLPRNARVIGLLAWLLLLLPFATISYLVTLNAFVGAVVAWVADVTLLYFAIGAQSLTLHAKAVFKPLSEQNLTQARHAISMIVSRDTSQLNETEVATATVESVLENGNDAIFGAIFWFVLFGGTGAVVFRLANTLDAMWGYRTPRFLYFGWAAARLDDLLNLIPARLTALSYALCGHTKSALKCWLTQASTWYSPNAGPVMSAGAGALQVKLGGNAVYHGAAKQRPTLGMGTLANPQHILNAVKLVRRSIVLWCIAIMLGSILINFTGSHYLA